MYSRDILCSRHLVVHLLRAVEDVDHDAEGSAQVLGGLGLPGAGRTGWGSTHNEMQRLRQSDVAPAFEPRKTHFSKTNTNVQSHKYRLPQIQVFASG